MMDRIETSVKETETRMMSYIESAVMPKFGEIESRMIDRIETSAKETESRMMSYIESAVMPEFGETESRMAAYMEAYFDPKFNALADGQKLLRETMASKSRVEELEEEVAFLKPTVMSMLTDIDHLKKAQ
ncbi:MAG: hypothetical protein HFF79_03490 [Oscillospiraceae bacterium]|nr:hypothetical protein [Oscillospiraceae bacterium]